MPKGPQPDLLIQRACHTCVAMAMAIVLGLLHGIDLVRHSLDILCLVWRDLLNALVLPMDVLPLGHCNLIFGFVCDFHLVVLIWVPSYSVYLEKKKQLERMVWRAEGICGSMTMRSQPMARACGVVQGGLDRRLPYGIWNPRILVSDLGRMECIMVKGGLEALLFG